MLLFVAPRFSSQFELLPTAELTFEAFNTSEVDKAPEADPPSFTRNMMSERRNRALEAGDFAALESDACNDKLAVKTRTTGKTMKRRQEVASMYTELEEEFGEDEDIGDAPPSTQLALIEAVPENASSKEKEKAEAARALAVIRPDIVATNSSGQVVRVAHSQASKTEKRMAIARSQNVVSYDPIKGKAFGATSGNFTKTEQVIDLDSWISSIPNDSEMKAEIDGLIRSKEETDEKGRVFDSMNKEFLAKQEKKRAKKEEDERVAARKEAESREQDEKAEAYQKAKEGGGDALGQPGVKKKKSDKSKGKSGRSGAQALPPSDQQDPNAPNTVQGALLAAVESRAKTSKKIDYESLQSLFDNDGDTFLGSLGRANAGDEGSTAAGSDDSDSDDGSEGSAEEVRACESRSEPILSPFLTSSISFVAGGGSPDHQGRSGYAEEEDVAQYHER